MNSKGFKLEDIGEVVSEGIQEIINSFNFGEELQPAYLAACGCDNYRQCQCVEFFGCKSNNCDCDHYDFTEDDCAKYKCAINCTDRRGW